LLKIRIALEYFPASYNLVAISNFTATSSILMLFDIRCRNKATAVIEILFFHFFYFFDDFLVEIILEIIPKFRGKLVINLATSKYIFCLKKASFILLFDFFEQIIYHRSELSTFTKVNVQCFLIFLKNEILV
jgi:hypothetical protein